MNCPGNNFVTTFLRVDKRIIIICLPRDLSGFTPDNSRGPLAPEGFIWGKADVPDFENN